MYVVVGANGFLGSYIVKAISEKTNEKIIATARHTEACKDTDRLRWVNLDVQDEKSVEALLAMCQKEDDVKMVYLAAYHHPDLVEKNKELAWDINITALSKFLNQARFAKKIYYSSTDSVYGNSVDGYAFKEHDPLNPVNEYGHQKCAAEALMIHAGRNVVRFPFLISPSLADKPHFYDQIASTIKAGKTFEMFVDSYRSSLSFENAANLLIQLMETEHTEQIVNICGDQALSKYDVGKMIAEREGVNPELIVPVSMQQPKENFTVQRAVSTLMDNTLLKSILNISEIDIFEKPVYVGKE